MKRTFYAICALGVIIGDFGCTTAGNRAVSTAAPSGPAVVTIDFVDPERFTDFRVNDQDFRRSSTVFTRDVTSALRPVMARRFPGHTLKLRYTVSVLPTARLRASVDSVVNFCVPRRRGSVRRLDSSNCLLILAIPSRDSHGCGF